MTNIVFLLQHDEFADTMPASEQEFIFIRLCVLREVRSVRCLLEFLKRLLVVFLDM